MGVLTNDGLKRLWEKIKTSLDKKVDSDYVASRGENLVTNGTCLLSNNKNFSRFIFDGSDTYYAGGSFKVVSKNANLTNDEFIPVDTANKYLLSYYIKNDTADARYYDMLVMYDIDKREIGARNVMWIPGSTTKLAKELKNGDTVVYLEDASGFDKTTTASYRRGLIFWNYQNSNGYTYGTETYSRNRWDALWDDGSAIDTTNNTITLKIPWNHGTFPAGTSLSQCSDGGTYTYMNGYYAIPTNTWTQKRGTVSGVGKNNASGKFREGTAFIKIGWLIPYQCKTQTTTWLSTISLTQNASIADVDRIKTGTDGATLDKIYPIGTIYMSVNSTDPSTLFGGTWVRWGAGRMPISVDDSKEWLSGPEKTGGEYTHTLTANELPRHKHDVNAVDIPSSGAHAHTLNEHVWVDQSKKNISSGTSTGKMTTTAIMNSGGAHTHRVPIHNTDYTGNGAAHENMPPWISVYMWKRTA